MGEATNENGSVDANALKDDGDVGGRLGHGHGTPPLSPLSHASPEVDKRPSGPGSGSREPISKRVQYQHQQRK